MSVPAYLRDESKALFVTNAVHLAALMLKWCKDDRLFTRRERWIITGDVWTQAKRILICVKQANSRKDLASDADFTAREAYLSEALDALEALKVLLTIKYEMLMQGFDAPKKPPAKQAGQAVADPGQDAQPKKSRGGKAKLTQADIDRIFENMFNLAIKEHDLIKGTMRSDAQRHAEGKAPV